MAGSNDRVPSVLTHELPRPVPADELAACPVTEVFRRVGDRWSMLLVIVLGGRPHRYNELHRSIEGISQRMLTTTLRQLERDGLVRRTVYPVVPPRVDYELTALGFSLQESLGPLGQWLRENHGAVKAARVAFEQRTASVSTQRSAVPEALISR